MSHNFHTTFTHFALNSVWGWGENLVWRGLNVVHLINPPGCFAGSSALRCARVCTKACWRACWPARIQWEKGSGVQRRARGNTKIQNNSQKLPVYYLAKQHGYWDSGPWLPQNNTSCFSHVFDVMAIVRENTKIQNNSQKLPMYFLGNQHSYWGFCVLCPKIIQTAFPMYFMYFCFVWPVWLMFGLFLVYFI